MSIRSIEHQGDSVIGKQESLGAKEHMQYYHGQFDWLHPWNLAFTWKFIGKKTSL